MDDAKDLVVPPGLDGQRLDKALSSLLGVSRSTARRLVEAGALVDGSPGSPSTRVMVGSVIWAPMMPEPVSLVAEPVEFGVLYEDEDLVVVDKPPGLVVHPGAGAATTTLAAGLLYRYPELEGVGQPGRWGLVHRLDKDTSGTLLVARNESSYRVLASLIGDRQIRRTYLTVVHGLVGSQTGTIEAPIGRDPVRPTRRALTHDGKPARTHYEVLEKLGVADCTLLEVTLDTGRTHQIRVHLAAIDHAVIGDRVYGSKPGAVATPRMFLHAAEIGFTHPKTGKALSISSDLPADLVSVLDALRSAS